MSSVRLAFSSDRAGSERIQPTRVSSLAEGAHAVVIEVRGEPSERSDRLVALGVTPGAEVRVLQTVPGIVFECDQTEVAIERLVARAIWIELEDV